MRDDVVEARGVLDHPRDEVWRVIGTPELYSRFVPEISWCEVVEQAERGRGPRCVIRLCPQRDVVVEQPLHAVVYRYGEHIVWGSPGNGNRRNWVSLELRDLDDRRTELIVQLKMLASELHDSDLVSASALRRRVRQVAGWINRHLAGRPAPPELLHKQQNDGHSSALGVATTLVKAGVIAPGRPDKIVRQLSSVARWGATLPGAYQAAAAFSPQELALHDEGGGRTFAETEDRSTRLANALDRRGVQAGHRVALMCRNHAAMVESLIACGKLGADVVLLNTGLSPGAIAKVIAEHRPTAVLADDEFAPVIGPVRGNFLRISTWPESATGYPTVDDLISKAPNTKREPVDKPGRIVVLTSGTSGMPKGARRPTPKGMGTAASLLGRIPLRAHDRILVAAPLFHAWGLAGLQIGMALRASLFLPRRFNAEEALHTIAEHRCTAMFAVPIMLQRILDLPERVRHKYNVSSLRVVASSGSALAGSFVTDFMNEFGDILYNLYGSTEVSWASIADPNDLRAAPTTAGRCPPGTAVAVLDQSGRPVPPGVDGAIYVGNEMLFDGYTDGGSPPRIHELMSTGDVGYVDADGRLFVTGRADEMIVSGGENVFPRPVEEALQALPQVSEVAVVGVPDERFGQRLAAYIVLHRGATLDPDAVRDYIHERLARFAVPRDVYFVRELPRNATGKILKRLLNDDTWPLGP